MILLYTYEVSFDVVEECFLYASVFPLDGISELRISSIVLSCRNNCKDQASPRLFQEYCKVSVYTAAILNLLH